MSGLTVGIYAVSAVLFFGGIHFLLMIRRPGVYPPKYILKKRAVAMATGGAVFLLIGVIIQSFQ